jgi:hypothetical protein
MAELSLWLPLGVVALELIVDLRGRAELLLKAVGAHERRRAVHLVENGMSCGMGIKAVVLSSSCLTSSSQNTWRARRRSWACACRGSAGARACSSCPRAYCTTASAFRFRTDRFCTGFQTSREYHLSFLDSVSRDNKKTPVPQSNCWDRRENLLRCHPAWRLRALFSYANTYRLLITQRPLRLAYFVRSALGSPFGPVPRTAFPPTAAL